MKLLAAGASPDEIIADYAMLETDDIKAALFYAARPADHTVLPSAYHYSCRFTLQCAR